MGLKIVVIKKKDRKGTGWPYSTRVYDDRRVALPVVYCIMSEHEFRRNRKSTSTHSGNDESLLDYLRGFDPIGKKYRARNVSAFPALARAYASEFEYFHQFGAISKQEYSYIQENLKLVYGDPGDVKDDIDAYYLTEERIIHRYLAIPQLDKMFDEDYFNFEWDMHVGQNFNEHHNDYYRDHFIHQIRDMYMMLVLLDKFGFYEAAAHILQKKNFSKISDYVEKKYLAFISDKYAPQYVLLKKVFAAIRDGGAQDFVLSKYVSDYYYQYVIYAASMLSALFHDMGYPICHFLEVRHRLSDYNPTLYMFTQNTTDSFDQLASLLSPSLLFTLVPTHRIKASLQANKNGKYNHGAYSAMAFLLQFYNNGVIFSLSPEKQCAIELAALAIYNHTEQFNIIKYDEANGYYAPFFQQNPVSYLLRLCDDLQEWDRRYFEISRSSDLMFCPECGAPLMKTTEGAETRYSCRCVGKNALRRPDIFTKRKLYLVTVADTVSVKHADNSDTLDITIHYDLYKLLLLANMNETYAKHRLKELSDLKKLISCQNLQFASDARLPFKYIKINYFMTANPLLIKLKILERYIIGADPGIRDERKPSQKRQKLIKAIRDFEDKPETFGKDNLQSIIKPGTPLYNYLVTRKGIVFYLNLLKHCLAGTYRADAKCARFVNVYQGKNKLYYDAMSMLVQDCVRQYNRAKEIEADGSNAPIHDAYFERYADEIYEDKLYHSISVYTEANNYFNRHETKPGGPPCPYISYFEDIMLFYEMNQLLNN